MVACLIGLGYFGVTIFIGFAFLVVFTLLSLAIQIREDRQAHEAALVRSARLETQLLKSHIRPHFIEYANIPHHLGGRIAEGRNRVY